jgi:hypothetical protein
MWGWAGHRASLIVLSTHQTSLIVPLDAPTVLVVATHISILHLLVIKGRGIGPRNKSSCSFYSCCIRHQFLESHVLVSECEICCSVNIPPCLYLQVIVVSIRPRMRVLFTQSLLHTSPATLPLLAWQFVIIQMVDGTRVIDPVLAFARESTIFFFQVNQFILFYIYQQHESFENLYV